MTRRDQLIQAVHTGDRDTVAELGWLPFFRDLGSFWAKKLSTDQCIAYARVLGDHDPGLVAAILTDLAATGQAEYRPRPAQLAATLATSTTTPAASSRRPDLSPIALARVRELHERGDGVCDCSVPRHLSRCAAGVLRCTTCQGLEPGQVDLALEDEEAAA